jgi:hypothetical protein
MTDHDRLVSAILHIDEIVTLLPENNYQQFLFFKLLSIKTELESQLNQLTRNQTQPKIKE